MILHCITPITLSNFRLEACDITNIHIFLLSIDISSNFLLIISLYFYRFHFDTTLLIPITLYKSYNLYLNMSVFIMKLLHPKLFIYTIIHFYQIYQMNMLSQKMEKWSYFLCLDEQKLRWMIFMWLLILVSCDMIQIVLCYSYILVVGTFQIHCKIINVIYRERK